MEEKIVRSKRIFISFIFSSLIFLLLFSSFTSAKNNQIFQADGVGYTLDYPKFDSVKELTNFTFYTHVYNNSNGLALNGTLVDCYIHLHNSTGDQFYEEEVPFIGGIEFSLVIPASNFPLGTYSYIIFCNSTNFGGFVSGNYDVTPSGESGTSSDITLIIILFVLGYALALIGLFGRNEYVAIFGGMFMLSLSVYTINEGLLIFRDWITLAISYITMGLGAYISILSTLSLIDK